eukprot:2114981-Pyramimonas_sp.AAC.1
MKEEEQEDEEQQQQQQQQQGTLPWRRAEGRPGVDEPPGRQAIVWALVRVARADGGRERRQC